MNRSLLTLTLCSSLLLACSKSGGGGPSPAPVRFEEPLETELSGAYQAVFAPINKTVSGHLNGALTVVRENDDLIVDVRFANGPAGSMHTQSIHIGERCPTESDDLNQDGFVDAEEAAAVVKEVLVPLDDDINTQWMGLGTYPVSDDYGYYFWSRTANYEKFLQDLRDEDINLTDDYTKLPANRSLTLIGKVVVIRGVPESTPLPETVQGRGRMTKFQGLPVACGVIRRQGEVPGVIDSGETGIPVPIGETVGGSSGADDGALFPPAGTTTGNTGNYGEDDDFMENDNSVDPNEM